MKTLYEGILDDMDNILDRGESDLESALNIPTIKDFQQNPYNKKYYSVSWKCPFIDEYKRKYNWIPENYDYIAFCLDTSLIRVVDLNIFVAEKKDIVSKKKFIPGWRDGFIGANLRTYKKMVINYITKLAHNKKALDEIFEYANIAYKNENHDMKIISTLLD